MQGWMFQCLRIFSRVRSDQSWRRVDSAIVEIHDRQIVCVKSADFAEVMLPAAGQMGRVLI